MKFNIAISALAAILVIAVAAYLGYVSAPLAHAPTATSTTPVATSTVPSFVAEGNVVRNNPGLKPNVWYLLYEQPGKPALSVELDLNGAEQPYLDLSQGKRVHVEGDLTSSSTLRVHSITTAQ
jgi:hypothetical protein